LNKQKRMNLQSLDTLLAPKSVAIIGASDDPARVGGRPIHRLLSAGYQGAIYPVNPKRSEVQGLKAYPSIAAIEGEIDCAVIAIAAEAALEAVEDCAKKGVKSLVVFSAGFAEVGEEGQRTQDRMVEIARAAGMRILGPNCLGMYNVSQRLYLTFTGMFQESWTPGRNIGVVSQSGGYGSHVVKLAQNRNLAIGHWITTGNEADVEFGEAIAALAAKPEVNVILAYIEGVRNRETFLKGLEIAHQHRKPVVVLKVGKSEAGAAAAASHTASLAGADAVYDSIFADYGAYRAASMEEALDVVYAASMGIFPEDGRLGLVTASGGVGVQMADAASDAGLDLLDVPADVQRAIMELVPMGSARNPIDLLGTMLSDPEMVEQALEILLARGGFSMLQTFVGVNGLNPKLTDPFIALLTRLREKYPAKLFAISAVATPEAAAAFEKIGCLLFEDPCRGVKALAALTHFARAFDKPLPSRATAAIEPGERLTPARSFNESEGKAILAAHGVGVPRERIAYNAKGACDAADALGYPVVLKILSPDILHKTEVGGVALGLASRDAVSAAVKKMASDIARNAPDAKIDGYLVGEMVGGGVECIIGVNNDPLFGPVIMFGLGGVFVELMKDVTFRLAPVSEEEALAMVQSVKGFPLLNGYRGKPKADIQALVKAIAGISRLATANADRLQTLEVNPILVMPEGRGVVALDAVIETKAI
jgi:acyl-CoA synthetase (NDP forming)